MSNLRQSVDVPLYSFPSGAAETAVDRELRDVGELTASLFDAAYRIEQVEDPEIPGEAYFVFHVSADGTVDEIVAKYHEWHRGLQRIDVKRSGVFRLSVDAP